MSYGEEEFDYEWPDDGEGQGGWGSAGEGDEEDNPRIEVENLFYEADGNKKDKPQEAIE